MRKGEKNKEFDILLLLLEKEVISTDNKKHPYRHLINEDF